MVLLFSRAKPFVQFGRGHYEEHFCEIIMIILVALKYYLRKETIWAILVEGIMRNILNEPVVQ